MRADCGSLAVSKSYEFLRDWVAEGAKDDPAAPLPVALTITPGARVSERAGEEPADSPSR